MPPWLERLRRFGALALVCALSGVTPVALAQPSPEGGPVQTRTLPNGLTVVTIEDDAVAVVETSLWIRFGAADEQPRKTGVAHALGHLLFDGTPSLSRAGFDDVVMQLAASATVTTGNDYTRYALLVPASELDVALRIDADRFAHASLTAAAWTLERNALRAEGDATRAQPLAHLYDEVCRAATSTPLCATAALGAPSDVASLTPEDLRAAYNAWYVAGNATVVIAGDVRAQDAFARASAVFAGLPRRMPPQRTAGAAQFARDADIRSSGVAPYDAIDVAYAAPGSNDERAGAFALLDAVLNDRRSEIAKTLLDGGYAVSFATRWDRDVRGGLYHVFIIVAPNHASPLVKATFLQAVARTRDADVSPELVGAAKTALLRRTEDAGDSLDGIAQHVGYAVAVENVAGPGRDSEGIATASAADVAAAARIFLQAPAATGVLAGNGAGDDAALRLPPAVLTDDFSRRRPAGRLVEPAWLRRSLAKPVDIPSGIRPNAFALPSGLRVLVQSDHANPTVFVSGSVEESPRFDARGREGTGDMLAALLATGGAKYDAAARRTIAQTLGAQFAFGFSFGAHGDARDLRTMLDVLADAVMTPVFAVDDVERERSVLRATSRAPSLDRVAERDFAQLFLRRGDPGRRAPSDASLRAISIEDLRAYARRYVRPDLTTLAIVGDVDAAAVRSDIEATFGAWARAGATPDDELLPFASARAATVAVGARRGRLQIRIGTPAVPLGARDYFPLAVLGEVLAQRRYAPGSAGLEADRFNGRLEVRFETTAGRLPAARAGLRRELRSLQRPIAKAEILRAESALVARPLVAEQATERVAERVRDIGVYRLPLDVENTLPGRYRAVGARDVARVARTYLHPGRLIEVDEGATP